MGAAETGVAGYIAAWRPSSVPAAGGARSPGRWWRGGAARPGTGQEPAVGGGQAR